MKIFDVLDETTEHETAISGVANAVARYLVGVEIPHLIQTVYKGQSVSSINDPELEYFLLRGFPLKNGYIVGEPVPENLENEFYIPLGKLTSMISKYSGLDKQVVSVIRKVKMYFMLTYGNTEALYDTESDEIYIMLNKIFSGKNDVNEKKLASLISHEIRHALDKHISKGRIFSGDEEKLKSVENDEEDKKHKTYLRLQSEGNARFSQTARDLIDYVENTEDMDINKFKLILKELTEIYALMETSRKKLYRSFMKRAYKLYDHLKNGGQ